MKEAKCSMGMTIKHFIYKRGNFSGILTTTVLFLAAVNAEAVQFIKLFDFNGPNGNAPYAGLLVSGNTLYGTTLVGSTNGNSNGTADGVGTVFRINTDGTGFTNLYSFSGTVGGTNSDGGYPHADLVLSGNILYGTASEGGIYEFGTVFKVNSDGTGFATLHNFGLGGNFPTDGMNPFAGLVLSSNTLYGTTPEGGLWNTDIPASSGTIFKINTDGTGYTVLYSFAAPDSAGGGSTLFNSDGASPRAGLVLSNNTLYGATSTGGSNAAGTIFKINTGGTGFAVLHDFSATSGSNYTNSDGAMPYGGLTLSGNILYGTTQGGGNYGYGTVFRVNTDGTGFTNLYNFNTSDGGGPVGDLLLSGNILYGVGGNGAGTVFAITTDGTGFTNLYSVPFSPTGDYLNGAYPRAGLVFSGNTLYGTMSGGGTNGSAGVVFSLKPSRPIINNIVLNTNNTVTISCSGDADFAYWMQAATNLAPPISWLTVSTNVADTNGNWQFTDSITNGGVFILCETNLVYSGPGSIDPGQPGSTNVIGTNVSCNCTSMRFYRAATAP